MEGGACGRDQHRRAQWSAQEVGAVALLARERLVGDEQRPVPLLLEPAGQLGGPKGAGTDHRPCLPAQVPGHAGRRRVFYPVRSAVTMHGRQPCFILELVALVVGPSALKDPKQTIWSRDMASG